MTWANDIQHAKNSGSLLTNITHFLFHFYQFISLCQLTLKWPLFTWSKLQICCLYHPQSFTSGIRLQLESNLVPMKWKSSNYPHKKVFLTLEAKKGSSVTVDCTNEHSTTFGTPLSPFKQASANMAPAYLHSSHCCQSKQLNAILLPSKVTNCKSYFPTKQNPHP